MNIKTVEHLIMQGKGFVYSAEYGNLENISIETEVEEYELITADDPSRQLTNLFRLSAMLRGLIRGEQTDLGYVISVERFTITPMTARQWFEAQFGKASHGVSQFKVMDDYADYFYNIKVGSHAE